MSFDNSPFGYMPFLYSSALRRSALINNPKQNETVHRLRESFSALLFACFILSQKPVLPGISENKNCIDKTNSLSEAVCPPQNFPGFRSCRFSSVPKNHSKGKTPLSLVGLSNRKNR